MTHYDSTLGFPDRSGWNAFLSRDGVLWISTEQGNLYRVEPFRKTVSTTITGTERVRDFFEESDGSLWLGTQGNGLLLYDQNKQLIRQYKHTSSDPKSISNDHVHCFFRDEQDNFWLGTEEGIEIFDKSTQEFSRLPVDQSLKDSVRAPVFQIMQDTKGSHWFTSFGKGLFRYNARDNSVKRYVPDKMDSTSIGSRYVIDVLEDRLGLLCQGLD